MIKGRWAPQIQTGFHLCQSGESCIWDRCPLRFAGMPFQCCWCSACVHGVQCRSHPCLQTPRCGTYHLHRAPPPGKVCDHIPVNMTVLHQVGVHPAHIPVGRRQRKRFGRRRVFLLCLRIALALLPTQEHRHRLREGHSVVCSDKINGVAAGLGLVVQTTRCLGWSHCGRSPAGSPGRREGAFPPCRRRNSARSTSLAWRFCSSVK